ncbi:MAG: hypothetical protein A2W17_01415 [Planctomycetes bacterium RBG_16_41_13]|nr:MAG: hypothetical protein A2W17_01415 [Planctomycetes bacterium RBG_16_41_13]
MENTNKSKSISSVAKMLGIPDYRIYNLIKLGKIVKGDYKLIDGKKYFTPKNIIKIIGLLKRRHKGMITEIPGTKVVVENHDKKAKVYLNKPVIYQRSWGLFDK